MASTIDSQILDALDRVLITLPWAAKVETRNIKLGFSELREHEVPYVQAYGVMQNYVPDRTELTTTWRIQVDLVLHSSSAGTVDLRILNDRRQEVIETIGADPKLGIAIIQITPVDSQDDIHIFEPYYFTTIAFDVLYRKPFVRPC